MAGMDASANLGGMLSQIGGTLGSMGQAGQGLMRPITMAFRPQLDPNDPDSLRRQADFFGKIGQTEQQKVFANQAIVRNEQIKGQQQQQGRAAVSKIYQAMQENEANALLDPEAKAERRSSLQAALDAAASRFGLDPTETMGLGRELQSQFSTMRSKELDNQAAIRGMQAQNAYSELFRLRTAGNEEEFNKKSQELIAQGFGKTVQDFNTAQIEYAEKAEEYRARREASGAFTEEEKALAKDLGINAATLNAWSSNPRLGREALFKAADDREKARLAGGGKKAASFAVLQKYVPGVLQEFVNEGPAWFRTFDEDMASLSAKVLDDEQAMEQLAAAVSLAGATTPQEIKAVVVQELSKRDNSIFQKYFGATNAGEAYLESTGQEIVEGPGGVPIIIKIEEDAPENDPNAPLPSRMSAEERRLGRLNAPLM
jgi:hypothetical protein